MSTASLWDSEEDPSEHFGSDSDSTRDKTSSDSHPITPTNILPQPTPVVPLCDPNRPRPRTRETTRKRVALPIRSGLTITRQDTAETSCILPGIPTGGTVGMTQDEARILQSVVDGLQSCQDRVSSHSLAISKLTELVHLLEEGTSNAVEKALTAQSIARRAEMCGEVVAIIVAMLILMGVALVYHVY